MISFQLPDSIEALNGGLFVSPGFGTHAVRVIDSYELIFVTQDSLDLFEGDKSYHIGQNEAMVLSPGVRHGGQRPYSAGVNFYWAHFRLHPLPEHGVRLAVPKAAPVRNPEGLRELFCRFISDQESQILDPCSASQLISLMLCSLGEGPVCEGRRHSVLVEQVHRYIEERFRSDISTSRIARALRHNPDYLERVFHGQEGLSIVDAIHQKRIGTAKTLLLNDARRNINEIGFECGYADAGYFRRMFKRLTGLTPREFRSLYARTHINTH